MLVNADSLPELFNEPEHRKLAHQLLTALQDPTVAKAFAKACDLPHARAITHESVHFGLTAARVADTMKDLAYAVLANLLS